ncbi:mitochondrial [Chlorella sorokiniana]|uniref:Mitochondrial n=1 Tax=Chlorella sorokiniana TaxID=3076 RepID=A0A2P6TR35_CHLSO|nr:mitochondrial [Chlorella sorokiniana]|eukprot:PRW56532.1 mitochondrial [Chlorella sorokiniana]
MPPKAAQQQQQQRQTASSSAASGGKPAGGNGGQKVMNYFAALAGTADADSQLEEIAAEEDRRRQASSSSSGGGGAANGKKSAVGGLQQPLVWIDLEMTGLDVERDQILQIAVICTDGSLEEEVEGPEITIHQPEEVLQTMNEWCVEQHGKSGLTQGCRDSTISLAEAEQQVLAFVQQHAPEPGTAQIAGNSVHVDLAFLRKHMPRLVDHLHYRIVDVSTVGELCRRWFPKEHMRGPKKKNTHTALSDIKESIAQLKYYRRSIFKKWAGMF